MSIRERLLASVFVSPQESVIFLGNTRKTRKERKHYARAARWSSCGATNNAPKNFFDAAQFRAKNPASRARKNARIDAARGRAMRDRVDAVTGRSPSRRRAGSVAQRVRAGEVECASYRGIQMCADNKRARENAFWTTRVFPRNGGAINRRALLRRGPAQSAKCRI